MSAQQITALDAAKPLLFLWTASGAARVISAVRHERMAWHQSQIQLQDRVASAIIDDQFSSSAPVHELPCLNWFGLWFVGNAAPDEFVPKGDEESFRKVERSLIEACGRRANGWAVYCLRLVSRGIAEYYFYSRDGETLSGVVADLQAAFPERRFEHETKGDSEWAEYRKYLNAIR